MPRYGSEYGRREMTGPGERDRGYGTEAGRRGGYGYEGWGMRGGMDQYDRMMRGTGYGSGGGHGGREMGYGSGRYGQQGQDAGRGGADRMRAAEIMTEDPECVTPDTTLADVARRMRDLDVGIIPVVDSLEQRRLRGVITDRDIAVRAVADGKDPSTTVAEYMTPDVETVNKNDPVRQVLELMGREQVRRVPVTDREGRLVGIIAQADLAVEYAEGAQRERQMEHTLERISEPAHPRRGRGNG